jgi:hypothetical protein
MVEQLNVCKQQCLKVRSDIPWQACLKRTSSSFDLWWFRVIIRNICSTPAQEMGLGSKLRVGARFVQALCQISGSTHA